MNNWWKAGLLGAAALGATALTGGLGAGLVPGLLGGAGEGAAATTGAALGEGATTTAAATGAGTAETAAAAASPTAFVTAPVAAPWASAGGTSGLLAGTDMGYGTAASNSLLSAGGEAAGGTGAASGTLAGTELGYGTGSLAGGAPLGPSMVPMETATPTAMQQALNAAKMGGKAASAYGTVQGMMGGGQQGMPPPAPHPVYQGEQAPIAQQQGAPGAQNAFLQMLIQQRQRGMLG